MEFKSIIGKVWMRRIFFIVLVVLFLIYFWMSVSRSIDVGKVAPDFSLSDMQGNLVSLSSLRGKVVFLNFWATWCPSCLDEVAEIQVLNRQFDPRDFKVVTINVGEKKGLVDRFLQQYPYDFLILLDKGARVSDRYYVDTLPQTFIIDRNGVVVDSYTGYHNWSSPGILKYLKKFLPQH